METLKIHPHQPSFFLKHYLWHSILALLTLPIGWIVLETTLNLTWALGVWAIGVILLSVGLIHTQLCKRAYLSLSGEEVVREGGVFDHRKTVIPLSRITNVEISTSWFYKMLGSATLKIETAGVEGEVVAEDFGRSDVEAFHRELMGLMRKLPDSLPDAHAVADPSSQKDDDDD